MRRIRTLIFGTVTLGALLATASAPAHAYWRWHHGPRGWVRFWIAPGVVVAPPVIYAPPPPVYYAPPPVYYAPPPVYYAPPVSFGFGVRTH